MLPWTIDEIAALTGGKVKGRGDLWVQRVVLDSRQARPGDLFVAVRGKRTDGHRFLAQVAAKGALALVQKNPQGAKKPRGWVQVADTPQALLTLGRAHRLSWGGVVVAITGSVGKTTVKDMTAHLLSGWLRSAATLGNQNNQFGLPLTLLSLREEHDTAVVEVGINQPGEMEKLADAVRPDIVVLTGIGHAHIGFFKNQRQILREKLKLADFLPKGGVLVLPVSLKDSKKNRKIRTFGLSQGWIHAEDVRVEARRTKFFASLGTQRAPVSLNVPGLHNVENALAALAVGRSFGFPWKDLAKRLSLFRPKTPKRLQFIGRRGVLFVNDAYNASPESLRAALEVFRSLQVSGRKIAVLADMLELGRQSAVWHRRAFTWVRREAFQEVLLVGKFFPTAYRQTVGAVPFRVHCFSKTEDAARHLARSLEGGDAVLLKGSRAFKLERVMEVW